MDLKNYEIKLKSNIDKNDYEEIKSLERLCIEHDNISFKLELDYKLNSYVKNSANYNINEFMFFNENNLIGYIGIGDFGGEELEINGMVHPKCRRMGIFKRLFQLVKDEFQRREQNTMLLLSDSRSESGIAFIKSVTDVYNHSEYEMHLNMNAKQDILNTLKLRKAIVLDAKETARMDSVFFDMEVKENDKFIIENIINETTYVAEVNNSIAGKVRLEIIDGIGGIYGLGILPEYRGRGYGRELLVSSINILKEKNAKEILLQVELNNKNALNLYKSCGFTEKYVMDYYRLSKQIV